MARQQLFVPLVESTHQNRLTACAERVFYEQWEYENTPRSGVNDGYVLLELLLCPVGQRRPEPITPRDMRVATCVIQWLGTSCGNGFLRECERKIREQNAEWRPINDEAFQLNWKGKRYLPPKDKLDDLAHNIASRYIPIFQHANVELEDAISVALHRAYEAGEGKEDIENHDRHDTEANRSWVAEQMHRAFVDTVSTTEGSRRIVIQPEEVPV